MIAHRPALPLLVIVALFALLVTGCVPAGPGVIVDRVYIPAHYEYMPVGKVIVPVLNPEKWELVLKYDDGRIYWCDVPEAHYSIPNQHIYDCQNQREVVK